MQTELDHMISLHVNGARMGFTKSGDIRVGNFRDAGQREFAGQLVLRAISRFVALATNVTFASGQDYFDKLGSIHGQPVVQKHMAKASLHLEEAVMSVKQLAPFFLVSPLSTRESAGIVSPSATVSRTVYNSNPSPSLPSCWITGNANQQMLTRMAQVPQYSVPSPCT